MEMLREKWMDLECILRVESKGLAGRLTGAGEGASPLQVSCDALSLWYCPHL